MAALVPEVINVVHLLTSGDSSLEEEWTLFMSDDGWDKLLLLLLLKLSSLNKSDECDGM